MLAAVLAPAGTTAGPAVYAGTITFVGAEPSGIGLRLAGNTVTITLGPGHVAQARAALRRVEGTLRFAAPGLPKPLVFVVRPKGARLTGTAMQGSAKAAVTLTRGRTSPDTRLGFYSSPRVEIARLTRFGFSTAPFAVDGATGAFGAPPRLGARLDVHQYEVRISESGAVLAGTLTLPPGAGPHPGVVYVSGSGPTLARGGSVARERLRLARGRRAGLRQARKRPVDGPLPGKPCDRLDDQDASPATRSRRPAFSAHKKASTARASASTGSARAAGSSRRP